MTEARTICFQNVCGGSGCQDYLRALRRWSSQCIAMFVRGDEIKCQISLSLRVLFPMPTSSFAIVSKGIFPFHMLVF